MKKIRILAIAIAALSCGDSRQSAREESVENDEKAEAYSEEEITPQLKPDDSLSDTRHDVDTISSAQGARKQSARDSVD